MYGKQLKNMYVLSARTAKLDTHSYLKSTIIFLSKLLASMRRNYFPKRTSGSPLHTLSKLCDVTVGFVPPPPPLLMQCIDIFALAEGLLLLDIWWFVLFPKEEVYFDSRSNVKTKGHSQNNIIIWTWLLYLLRIIQVVPLKNMSHRVVFNRVHVVNIRGHMSRTHSRAHIY